MASRTNKNMSRQDSGVDVTIIVITYNQKNLLHDALDSILAQGSSVQTEILVGEDCSTDGTQVVLRTYEEKYPERFCVTYNKENTGATENLFNLLCKARGKYITFLEGDDYWLRHDRVMKLYEYLEQHEECAVVSHRRERRRANGELLGYDPEERLIGKDIRLDEYIDGCNFSIAGSMFRNCFGANAIPWHGVITAARNACDLVLCHILLHRGCAHVLNDCFGVYRVLTGVGNSNYCSVTKQVQVDMDYILQYRQIMRLFGYNPKLSRKVSELAFDGIAYCVKRRIGKEFGKFASQLTLREKLMFCWRFPALLVQRFRIKRSGGKTA